jgi:hypothetical protein
MAMSWSKTPPTPAAAIGRFLSRDTFPLNHQNPMELNRYVYAAGNPVKFRDPSGLQGLSNFGNLLKAVTIAALGVVAVTAFVALVLPHVTSLLLRLPSRDWQWNGTHGSIGIGRWSIANGTAISAYFGSDGISLHINV